MLLRLALLAAAPLVPPDKPLAGQLRAAIWHDLQVNAMIGNGNWLGSLWYKGGSPERPNLHIQALPCHGRDTVMRCAFRLFRDGGPVTTVFNGAVAPDTLDCVARFVRAQGHDGWWARHKPPRRRGHSRTAMRCRTVAG